MAQESFEDELEEELSTLEEDDFPDLVSEDDTDLMDEFAFLEDAEIVESAARHKQDIAMSPSAITLITREDIEVSGATDMYNLFRSVPGVGVALSNVTYNTLMGRRIWRNTQSRVF